MVQKVKCGDPRFVFDIDVRKLINTLKSRTPSNVKFYSHHEVKKTINNLMPESILHFRPELEFYLIQCRFYVEL